MSSASINGITGGTFFDDAVIRLNVSDVQPSETMSPATAPSNLEWDLIIKDDMEPNGSKFAVVHEMYHAPGGRLELVFSLLKTCRTRLEKALQFLASDMKVEADIELIALRPELQELYCLRSIGSGFSGVVGSLLNAFYNRHGQVFDLAQTDEILASINTLLGNPFLPLEDAIEIVNRMEDFGLDVDPPGATRLLEVLSDESP